MADLAEIERIARDVVTANISPDAVVSIASSPTIVVGGDEMLQIEVELRNEAVASLRGRTPSNILLQLSDQLVAIGEERFPLIRYATTEELENARAQSSSFD